MGLASEQRAANNQSLVLSGFHQCFWSLTQQDSHGHDSDSNCRAHFERPAIVSDIYRHKSIADLEKLFRRIRGDHRALAGLRDELGRRGSERARHLAVAVEGSMHAECTARAVREGPPPDYLPERGARSRTRLGDDPMLEPPPCPSCGASMVPRTAKAGRNAGGRFWGCPQFPWCRGTRDFSSESVQSGPVASDAGPSSAAPAESPSLALLPVAWTEEVPRTDFVPEYVSVGAVPGVVREHLSRDLRVERALSQCVLLSRRSRPRQAAEHARLASGLLVKMLQRGRAPLPTLTVEREALRAHGLMEAVRDLAAEGIETGWELRPGTPSSTSAEAILARITDRASFALDPAFSLDPGADNALLQSDAEAWFLHQWVPGALGASAGHWFTPQASLDKLLESGAIGVYGARRVDFLFSHPGGPPFVVEVDGPEHDSTLEVDKVRDDSLRAVGIDVLRVSNEEVIHGRGVVLDRILHRCREALTAFQATPGDDSAVAALVIDCAVAAKVQLAVARAVGFGWLAAGSEWEIDLVGDGNGVAAAGVLDALRLLAGIDVLYGGCSTPTRCTVRCNDGPGPSRGAPIMMVNGGKQPISKRKARACVSPSRPRRALSIDPRLTGTLDFVIRPVYLPVQFEAEQTSDFARRAIAPSSFEDARPALATFLRNIFRKYEFRPMQGEAIFNVATSEGLRGAASDRSRKEPHLPTRRPSDARLDARRGPAHFTD